MFEQFNFSLAKHGIPVRTADEEDREIISYGFFLPRMPRSQTDTEFIGSVVTVEMQSLDKTGMFQ